MNNWLELSRQLPILLLAGLIAFVLAVCLFDGLRWMVRSLRARMSAPTPEEEAVDAVVQHQGAFHLQEPGAVRQRFARRYQVAVRSHWGAGGHWKSLD